MIQPLPTPPTAPDRAAPSALLRDAGESGASVGFLLPLTAANAPPTGPVSSRPAPPARACASSPATTPPTSSGASHSSARKNPHARHRCELQKIPGIRAHRGRRLGFTLLRSAETAALARGRTLIVLDPGASGHALTLYDRCGYTRAGVIPRSATDPDGTLIDPMVCSQELAVAPQP